MSVLALKRNYQLEMPQSYVSVEKEEMQYVDGGAEKIDYWWGYAINMSADECKSILPVFKKGVALTTFAALCASKLKIGYSTAIQIGIGLVALNFANTVVDLESGSNGGGATLSKNIAGYWITVY